MTVLYQIVKWLALPLSFILLLLVTGFTLILWRFRRSGKIMLALGILLLYVLSISPTAELLLEPLENSHTPLSPKMVPRVGTLVVLSGGVSASTDVPTSSRLSQGSMRRAIEAIRLYRLMDRPTIVVSGGSGNPFVKVSDAAVMREFLLDLGIPSRRIRIEGRSRDTYENARLVQQLRLNRPIILVTSASHMPRALRVFKAQGMRAVPAPCDFRSRSSVGNPLRFFPSSGSLSTSTTAIYEYLGTWWYDLRGRF